MLKWATFPLNNQICITGRCRLMSSTLNKSDTHTETQTHGEYAQQVSRHDVWKLMTLTVRPPPVKLIFIMIICTSS